MQINHTELKLRFNMAPFSCAFVPDDGISKALRNTLPLRIKKPYPIYSFLIIEFSRLLPSS